MKLNLIAEPILIIISLIGFHVLYNNLEPGSSMISVDFRNLSGKKNIIPAKAVICQLQMNNMIAKLYPPEGQK